MKILSLFFVIFLAGCFNPTYEGFAQKLDSRVGEELLVGTGFIGKFNFSDTEYIYKYKIRHESSCSAKYTTQEYAEKHKIKSTAIVGFITDKSNRYVKEMKSIDPPYFCMEGVIFAGTAWELVALDHKTAEFLDILDSREIPLKDAQSKLITDDKKNTVDLETRYKKTKIDDLTSMYEYKNSMGCKFAYIVNEKDKKVISWKILENKDQCKYYKNSITW